jgi:predicted nucleic acid-binding protein
MIVLDTNVVSAMMPEPPEAAVVRFLDARLADSIWTTSITIFEIRLGVERLPASRRRRELEEAFPRAVERTFRDRILPFDEAAANSAAILNAIRERRGRLMEVRDTMIAGIVISRGAEFATRNVRHFADLDISVIDPWGA